MLLKTKLNRFADNENIPIDKDKDKNKDNDNDNDRTICIIKIKDKRKSECKDEDMLTKVSSIQIMNVIRSDYQVLRKYVNIYQNNNTIYDIYEKWIFHSNNYAYISFEELRTCSDVSLYNREHKATLSKKIQATTQILMIRIYVYI